MWGPPPALLFWGGMIIQFFHLYEVGVVDNIMYCKTR
jgi:hypothetical protein